MTGFDDMRIFAANDKVGDAQVFGGQSSTFAAGGEEGCGTAFAEGGAPS